MIDTPASIGPLTTYTTPAPTSVVQLFPNVSPAPSTLPAAVSLSATVTPTPNGVWSGSSSSTSTSSHSKPASNAGPQTETVTATSTPAPGLSTGAKAGIGVGVALGVVAVGVAAGACFFIRKRRRGQQADPSGSFPQKSAEWQNYTNAPPGSQAYYGYHGAPAVIHEAGTSDVQEDEVRKALNPPPTELDAEHDVPEMESLTSGTSRSPAPPYADSGK